MSFQRESRYGVYKIKDALQALSDDERAVMGMLLTKIDQYRDERGAKPLECVVVESDWPEYEEVWKTIELRSGDKAEEGALAVRVLGTDIARPLAIKKEALEKAINESIDDMHAWGPGSQDAFAIYQDNKVQVQVIVTNDPSDFMDQLYTPYTDA